jgi:integrase
MKKKKKADNLVVCPEGRARIYRKQTIRARWTDPEVPEYDPHWIVRFSVMRRRWMETGPVPITMGIRPVRDWVKERIRTEAALITEGKLEELRRLRAPRREVMLAELLRVYEEAVQGQPERVRDGARLAAIWTEVTGLPVSQIPVTDKLWSAEMLDRWVRMRQEHFRRGWTATKRPPENAWELLRAELAAGRLPGIDTSTPMACNTTIRNYLKAGRTVFSHGRRFVRGLVLPELREFLEYRHGLALPSGHREIEPEVVERIWDDLPGLRVRCERAWAFFQVLAFTGARPVSVKRMTVADLSWEADGWVRVRLPGTKGGDEVDAMLPPEVGEVLRRYAGPDGLLGGYLDRVHYKTLNPWLRARGVTDQHAVYLLRHRRGQQVRDGFGVEAAAESLGHKDTKMVKSIYSRARGVAPIIDPRTGEVIERAG